MTCIRVFPQPAKAGVDSALCWRTKVGTLQWAHNGAEWLVSALNEGRQGPSLFRARA